MMIGDDGKNEGDNNNHSDANHRKSYRGKDSKPINCLEIYLMLGSPIQPIKSGSLWQHIPRKGDEACEFQLCGVTQIDASV